MKERLTFIDFFSGIGGFHAGFEQAGIKCIGWCEFDNLIKNGTKKGYIEAHHGDGVDLSYPQSETRRARVQNIDIVNGLYDLAEKENERRNYNS